MKKTFAIILTLIGIITFGQENKLNLNENGLNSIELTELDSLYVKALNSRFDLILQSGWHYVEMNEYGKRISEMNVSDRFKFLNNEELINLSIKEKKTVRIIRLNHKTITKDTVDINFGDVSVTAKRGIFFYHGIRFKKADFSVGCGGTHGYQPDIRFVYDRKEKRWNSIENRFVTTAE